MGDDVLVGDYSIIGKPYRLVSGMVYSLGDVKTEIKKRKKYLLMKILFKGWRK